MPLHTQPPALEVSFFAAEGGDALGGASVSVGEVALWLAGALLLLACWLEPHRHVPLMISTCRVRLCYRCCSRARRIAGRPPLSLAAGNGLIHEGSRVETQWERAEGGDDCWFAGTVTYVTRDLAVVRYDDGDTWFARSPADLKSVCLLPDGFSASAPRGRDRPAHATEAVGLL